MFSVLTKIFIIRTQKFPDVVETVFLQENDFGGMGVIRLLHLATQDFVVIYEITFI